MFESKTRGRQERGRAIVEAMRSRLLLALVAVAACKGNEKKAESTGAAGSGSAADKPDLHQGKTAPDQPTKVVVADGIQAAGPRGDATMERRAAAGSAAPSSEPATPTPIGRPDGIAAAPPRADAGPVAILNEKALDASTLTIEAVTTKIRSVYAPQIRRCGAGKAGAISVAFTVNESGKVAAASSSDAFDPQVAACIVEKTKLFVFPAPAAKARFAMTFELRAG